MIKQYLQVTKPGIIFGNLISVIGGFLLAAKGNIDFLWSAHNNWAVSLPNLTRFLGRGDKKGVFVRLAGSTDVYMLPYTIKSDKPTAAERSLNSALATRKVEVLSVDDLNPAPVAPVQFKFVDPKTSK